MTKKNNTITIPASGTVLDSPLDKLEKSPRNERKTRTWKRISRRLPPASPQTACCKVRWSNPR
ncbi:MAG TPA: hypothetical protein VMT72_02975 [Pseudolabrys sp.]|nr:hypothetical protein [Pseudolabrys sp.]